MWFYLQVDPKPAAPVGKVLDHLDIVVVISSFSLQLWKSESNVTWSAFITLTCQRVLYAEFTIMEYSKFIDSN